MESQSASLTTFFNKEFHSGLSLVSPQWKFKHVQRMCTTWNSEASFSEWKRKRDVTSQNNVWWPMTSHPKLCNVLLVCKPGPSWQSRPQSCKVLVKCHCFQKGDIFIWSSWISRKCHYENKHFAASVMKTLWLSCGSFGVFKLEVETWGCREPWNGLFLGLASVHVTWPQ